MRRRLPKCEYLADSAFDCLKGKNAMDEVNLHVFATVGKRLK